MTNAQTLLYRLRTGANCSERGDRCRVLNAESGCDCAAAADEIERLRGVIKHMCGELCSPGDCQMRDCPRATHEPKVGETFPVGVLPDARLIRSTLFQQFIRQGFWHAHHVDLVWRMDGKDVREEADWLKDVWYALRASTPAQGASRDASSEPASVIDWPNKCCTKCRKLLVYESQPAHYAGWRLDCVCWDEPPAQRT